MIRVATVASVCVMSSVLLAGHARGEGFLGLSERVSDPSGSIVGSFLQSTSPELAALEGSFAASAPALSMPESLGSDMSAAGVALATAFLPAVPAADGPMRLMLARPRSRGETEQTTSQTTSSSSSKKEPVTRRVKPQTGPDALEFSRAAFPMVVGAVPTALADIRPMVGPVVGVRPAYIRPTSFE